MLHAFLQKLLNVILESGFKLIIAIITGIIGWKIIDKSVTNFINILLRKKVDRTICTFLESLLRISFKLFLVILILDFIGISTKSVTTIIASAGLAIGLALKSSLSNLAGGIIILLIKPFRIGDYIETSNHSGKVTKINVFYTYLINKENKEVLIPNGILVNSSFEKCGILK